MNVERWLAERTPAPPEALATRMRSLLGGREWQPNATTSDVLLQAAEDVLRRLMREGCATRESALDLLVVDALVTYAFEAAADEPRRFEERTHEAMLRIGALAAADDPLQRGPASPAADAAR